MFVYVGTYTEPGRGKAKGISLFEMDPATGELTFVQTTTDIANPSFLALDPEQRYLYAVSELEQSQVVAFARDRQTGELRELNRQSSEGKGPCYVSVDRSGRYALVANYGSGAVATLPIADDGSLKPATGVVQQTGSSVNPDRQEGPHAHMIASTPDGRYVLATDLGADQIITYRLDDTGQLVASSAANAHSGAGPRHFAFAPDGRTVYVINELDSSLTAYDYDGERGELRARQTVSSLPEDFSGQNTTAQVVVSPDGRFVYGSNRGHNSIATWAVDAGSGELSVAGHASTSGKEPRNFNIDPSGAWLLAGNQNSDTIVTFRRDIESGGLTATGSVVETPTPVAILFAQR